MDPSFIFSGSFDVKLMGLWLTTKISNQYLLQERCEIEATSLEFRLRIWSMSIQIWAQTFLTSLRISVSGRINESKKYKPKFQRRAPLISYALSHGRGRVGPQTARITFGCHGGCRCGNQKILPIFVKAQCQKMAKSWSSLHSRYPLGLTVTNRGKNRENRENREENHGVNREVNFDFLKS